VAALLGEHPFLDAADLAVAKLAREPGGQGNAAMRRGQHLEDAVARWWAAERGVTLIEPEELYLSTGTPCAPPSTGS
jgi:hypothetical protein